MPVWVAVGSTEMILRHRFIFVLGASLMPFPVGELKSGIGLFLPGLDLFSDDQYLRTKIKIICCFKKSFNGILKICLKIACFLFPFS